MSEATESLTYEDFLEIKKTRRLTEEEKKVWKRVNRKHYRETHREEIKAKREEYYKKFGEKCRKMHKDWLKKNADSQKNYRKDYWDKNKQEKLKQYDELKIKSYIKLGGCKCAICGDSEISHLTIDHINKDGKQEREKGFNSFTLLKAIVRDTLSKEQFENLRVLCWNHNKSRVRDYMDIPSDKQTSSQRHIHRLWKEAYKFFGPCKTCGITELKFLSISHVHDDGAMRRRNGEKQGPKLLSDFRKMGWPESLKEDFCFECFTCNCSRMTKRPILVSPSDYV